MQGTFKARIPYKGKMWEISVDFVSEEELEQILLRAVAKGWEPTPDSDWLTLTGSRSAGNINLIPNAQSVGCPEHGIKFLKEDQGGKGLYCGAKNNGKFCSKKSWKDWRK